MIPYAKFLQAHWVGQISKDHSSNWHLFFCLQQPTHPVYNIGPDKVIQATMHFLQKPVPGFEEHEDEATAGPSTD